MILGMKSATTVVGVAPCGPVRQVETSCRPTTSGLAVAISSAIAFMRASGSPLRTSLSNPVAAVSNAVPAGVVASGIRSVPRKTLRVMTVTRAVLEAGLGRLGGRDGNGDRCEEEGCGGGQPESCLHARTVRAPHDSRADCGRVASRP